VIAAVLGVLVWLDGPARAHGDGPAVARERAPASPAPTVEPVPTPTVIPLEVAPTPVVTPLEVPAAAPELDDEPELELDALVVPAPRARARARQGTPARAATAPGLSAAVPVVDGTLAISAKPPCRILVDDVDTGLTTPQRALRLPAGRHEITLVNDEFEIRDVSTIDVDAGGALRLVRDLSARIR
jgi:hypothetical protein